MWNYVDTQRHTWNHTNLTERLEIYRRMWQNTHTETHTHTQRHTHTHTESRRTSALCSYKKLRQTTKRDIRTSDPGSARLNTSCLMRTHTHTHTHTHCTHITHTHCTHTRHTHIQWGSGRALQVSGEKKREYQSTKKERKVCVCVCVCVCVVCVCARSCVCVCVCDRDFPELQDVSFVG